MAIERFNLQQLPFLYLEVDVVPNDEATNEEAINNEVINNEVINDVIKVEQPYKVLRYQVWVIQEIFQWFVSVQQILWHTMHLLQDIAMILRHSLQGELSLVLPCKLPMMHVVQILHAVRRVDLVDLDATKVDLVAIRIVSDLVALLILPMMHHPILHYPWIK